MILGKALVRISDCPDYTALDILLATNVIDDVPRHRIHQQGVDGEVAAAHIPMCAGKFYMRRPAPVLITTLGAKCGDFITMTLLNHNDDAKTHTHRRCMRKEQTDLLGPRRGNDVIISGLHATHEITHAPTHEVCFMAGISQSTNN